MLTTHLLMELFSVVVSALVVITAVSAISRDTEGMARPLLFGFTVVAGCDLVHALSTEGMPSFLSPNSTAKAIFFWLCGRVFELITVCLIAARISWNGSYIRWFAAAAIIIGLLIYTGTSHIDALPLMYETGKGVTPLKANIEVFLCMANLAMAGYFWWQYRKTGTQHAFYLACSSFIMGLGELMFTSYLTHGDIQNVLGHLFKVASYMVIYIGTFVKGMREPYEAVLRSEALAREKESELNAVVRQAPVGIFRLDKEGRFRYVNKCYAQMWGLSQGLIIGRRFEDVLPVWRHADLAYRWAAALQGANMRYEAIVHSEGAPDRVLTVSIGPETDLQGNVTGTLGVAMDATEQRETQRRLLESLKEVADFKAALDAHAIVAVTDPRGVITRVNEKFCQLSKYSEEELLGNTHRIVNSGHHSPAFFAEMWQTIGAGHVWNGDICNRAKDGSEYWVSTTIVPILDGLGRVQNYVALRADITERKRYEEQMQRMAFHDALTELPNRRLLTDRLQHGLAASQRNGHYGALVLLDLDHFKHINDTLGHEHGDALLRMVAERLQRHVRQSDTVARFGGDEFVVLYSELSEHAVESTQLAETLADALRRDLAQEYELLGHRFTCTASLGIVLFQGQTVLPTELLKQADIALYGDCTRRRSYRGRRPW